MNFSSILSPPNVKKTISDWIREDISSFDYGSCLFKSDETTASIILKEDGVLAGIPLVNAVMKVMHCKITWLKSEGVHITEVPCEVAVVTGLTRDIVRSERLTLNILTRACGIATVSRRMAEKLKALGWTGFMAGTRKTTPGFRLVEKYAMLVGGADTHRYDLSSMIMLKDNHIVASGSITKAVKASRRVGGFSVKIEVECQNLVEAEEAAVAGADIIMLDNMGPAELGPASTILKTKFPRGVLVEASGGITEESVGGYALPNVDIISCSRLSQGYSTLDLVMRLASHEE